MFDSARGTCHGPGRGVKPDEVDLVATAVFRGPQQIVDPAKWIPEPGRGRCLAGESARWSPRDSDRLCMPPTPCFNLRPLQSRSLYLIRRVHFARVNASNTIRSCYSHPRFTTSLSRSNFKKPQPHQRQPAAPAHHRRNRVRPQRARKDSRRELIRLGHRSSAPTDDRSSPAHGTPFERRPGISGSSNRVTSTRQGTLLHRP